MNFAIAVGEHFADIPNNVIEMQRRFLNNNQYPVPYISNLDVDFETMSIQNTEYKIIDLEDYHSSLKTGADFPRGTIERNKIIKHENILTQ